MLQSVSRLVWKGLPGIQQQTVCIRFCKWILRPGFFFFLSV